MRKSKMLALIALIVIWIGFGLIGALLFACPPPGSCTAAPSFDSIIIGLALAPITLLLGLLSGFAPLSLLGLIVGTISLFTLFKKEPS